jgi:hypothetical protein
MVEVALPRCPPGCGTASLCPSMDANHSVRGQLHLLHCSLRKGFLPEDFMGVNLGYPQNICFGSISGLFVNIWLGLQGSHGQLECVLKGVLA